MTMTLAEIRKSEYKELQERREKEKEDLKKELQNVLGNELVEMLSIISVSDDEEFYKVKIAFVLDGYRQEDDFYWNDDESKEDFAEKVKGRINYIKELREQFPEYAKQNDYIQSNREFKKKFNLTHMGYERAYELRLELADFMKLPNRTSVSFGGGAYEIKRTPQRVREYNENIDVAIDVLLDCISELKQKKYKED
ncbi:hypothetical protein [Oceanobacillus alkalisoli]|uniref:hypothetical protein n=1 Tax=Oceanobacillus alkalisoli TaxID=2925113 RepID=UPI001EE4B21A|nr:hypothetical protein [Oceanobacillus alkalisoli]MCG5104424.1 hypothetical protein [Oceanobacillus alkalisoli]